MNVRDMHSGIFSGGKWTFKKRNGYSRGKWTFDTQQRLPQIRKKLKIYLLWENGHTEISEEDCGNSNGIKAPELRTRKWGARL